MKKLPIIIFAIALNALWFSCASNKALATSDSTSHKNQVAEHESEAERTNSDANDNSKKNNNDLTEPVDAVQKEPDVFDDNMRPVSVIDEPLVHDESAQQREAQNSSAMRQNDAHTDAMQQQHDARTTASGQNTTASAQTAAQSSSTQNAAPSLAGQSAHQNDADSARQTSVVTAEPEVTFAESTDSTSDEADMLPVDASSSVAEEENAIPSRAIFVDKNDYLDVVYPGTGWVYLGEANGTKHMIFFGRKLGETNTVFTLRARQSGTTLLHFYKNDALTGNYIDDYLEVTVSENIAASQEHVVAPSYALLIPPRPTAQSDENIDASESRDADMQQTAAIQPQNTQSAAAQSDETIRTSVQTTELQNTQAQQQNAPSGVSLLSTDDRARSADDLLKLAQEAYGAKQHERALELLTLFFEKSTTRIDEGLYLQGQVLEAASNVQNIKNAIASYDVLMQNWPTSALWQDARKRSIYLKRMYIDIR